MAVAVPPSPAFQLPEPAVPCMAVSPASVSAATQHVPAPARPRWLPRCQEGEVFP